MQALRALARKRKGGFTLIELMIVVAIIGILAAIAIPAFIGYIRRSKTAEASENVRNLYSHAASYYLGEMTGQMLVAVGGTAVATTACTVPIADTMNTPGIGRTQINFQALMNPSFQALGFTISDPVYYRYHISASPGGVCGNMVSTPLYTFQAQGDLDGDGTLSTFELAAGSDAENELYRNAGFYIVNELE